MKLLQQLQTRRQLLGGACAMAAAFAADGAGAAETELLAAQPSLLLHDARFPLAHDLQQRLQSSGARIIPLEEDPVRMWRDQAALLQSRDTRMLGVTRWPEFLLIRGLAAESRRHVRYQRLDVDSGAIIWLIA